jgi:hypothetical protein
MLRRKREWDAGVLSARIASFWDNADRSGGPDACWPWAKQRHSRGYGYFCIKKRKKFAHRVAWELATGGDASGLVVMHSCDNPPCVNPAHLRLGTARDNAQDCIAKGRKLIVLGEDHGGAKLTEEDVVLIRKMAMSGKSSYEIAKTMPCSARQIRDIVSRKMWRHVD